MKLVHFQVYYLHILDLLNFAKDKCTIKLEIKCVEIFEAYFNTKYFRISLIATQIDSKVVIIHFGTHALSLLIRFVSSFLEYFNFS